MKKLLKNFKIIALIAVIGLSMSGCGKDDDKSSNYEVAMFTFAESSRLSYALGDVGIPNTNNLPYVSKSQGESLYYACKSRMNSYDYLQEDDGWTYSDIEEYVNYYASTGYLSYTDAEGILSRLKQNGYAVHAFLLYSSWTVLFAEEQ